MKTASLPAIRYVVRIGGCAVLFYIKPAEDGRTSARTVLEIVADNQATIFTSLNEARQTAAQYRLRTFTVDPL